VARTIDDAEARIREAEPIARAIYLEPDMWSADRAAHDTDGDFAGRPAAE